MPFVKPEHIDDNAMLCPIFESASLIAKAIIAVSERPLSTLSYQKDGLDADALETCCKGPDCMMWRFEKSAITYDDRDFGYCGLADRPLPWADLEAEVEEDD